MPFNEHINLLVLGTFPNCFKLMCRCCKVDLSSLVGVAKCRYSPAKGDAIWPLSPVNIHVYVITGSPRAIFLFAGCWEWWNGCLTQQAAEETFMSKNCSRYTMYEDTGRLSAMQVALTFLCPHWSNFIVWFTLCHWKKILIKVQLLH